MDWKKIVYVRGAHLDAFAFAENKELPANKERRKWYGAKVTGCSGSETWFFRRRCDADRCRKIVKEYKKTRGFTGRETIHNIIRIALDKRKTVIQHITSINIKRKMFLSSPEHSEGVNFFDYLKALDKYKIQADFLEKMEYEHGHGSH